MSLVCPRSFQFGEITAARQSSPAWHRHQRRSRARARRLLCQPRLGVASTASVSKAVNTLATHHGSHLSVRTWRELVMGKWWRCRQSGCGWYNPNASNSCGSCGSAFVVLPRHAGIDQHNVQYQQNRQHNHPSYSNAGAVNSSRKSRATRWGKYASDHRPSPEAEQQQGEAVEKSKEVDSIKEQMASLNKVVAALKGSTDESARTMVDSANAQLKSLRV